ncbi:MAG: YggT family protein [bacterium]|nr:YggT family protein [bacterium]
MAALLVYLLNLAYRIFFFLLLARAVASWLPGSGPTYYRLFGVLRRLTDPLLAPIRRVIPASGGLDFSPLVAMLLLGVVHRILVTLVWSLPF